jgi:hypothetical protein
MADQEVDAWIRATTSAVTAHDNHDAGCSSDIECNASMSKPLREDSYAILSVRYTERDTPSISIAKRLPADGRERTESRCTVDISSATVPNMLFWKAKSSDFRVRPKFEGLY